MSDDVELETDGDFAEEQAPAVSDKRQAEVNREARRRLEKKLEEAQLKKQTQAYYFDFD